MEEGHADAQGTSILGRRDQPAQNPKERAWCLKMGEEGGVAAAE